MTDTEFYIQRFTRNGVGEFVADGEERNLERDFLGLRYKSVTGLTSLGEMYQYAENYAEDERTQVFIPLNVVRKPTDITLSVYIFGIDPDLGNSGGLTDEEQLEEAQRTYWEFTEFLSGAYICYWDTVRRRKVMCYQYSAISVKEDKLYGLPYILAEIKLKNVYGRSFALDDAEFNPMED